MGIWDLINSATDAIKRNAPDPTPVTDACRRSYDLGSSAVAKVDNAVRVHGVQKLNDCTSTMGIWDVINSTTDAIKRNAPDPTPVTNACRRSYDLGSSAVAKVDNAVRVHGQKLNDHLSDPQVRDNIGRLSTNIAKNTATFALEEGVKLVPGGAPIVKIVSKSLNENKRPEHHKKLEHLPEEIKVLQAENMKLREEFYKIKALIEPKKLEPLESMKIQKPDDGINIFYDEGIYGY